MIWISLFAAGALDTLNPCAFATLLIWLGFLWQQVAQQGTYSDADIRTKRFCILKFAVIYAVSMTLVYAVFGLGWLSFKDLIPINFVPLFTKLSGGIVAAMSLLLIRDAFFPEQKPWVHMPQRFYGVVKKALRPMNTVAAVIGGALIGLCSVPCSGILYLGVLSALNTQSNTIRYIGFALYLAGFAAPVLATATLLSSRRTLTVLGRFAIRSRPYVRALIAGVSLLLGILAIWLS